MSSLAHTTSDSWTMLRRNLLHMLRYPSVTVILAGMPVIFLLLFVYVFGGTLGAGLGGVSGGRAQYVEYVTPGIVLMAVAAAAQGAALSVAMDMTEGIVARFRTMAISRAAVLTGHVVGSIVQTMIAVGIVLGVAVLVGFRPTAGPVEWLGTVGMVALVALALTWLCVALGMASGSVENASNVPMPLVLLPFFGSGFVPTESLPGGLRWFAEYQPFTPVTETLRGLLTGTPIGNSGLVAVLWCVGIATVGYFWARAAYHRASVR
ncbi:ABC transporter permease [Plantactinospora endophytica]|uniref:Transport permease protein n=1 Tax=Plantactinospora endophytica TaxID=673535 RepID=A0ABQ4E1T7_9ACTN|nr:ABC transporter permease [Plantactinospora endophytica]GIG88658.1 transport permease protein [Plantactinospora endophytica]